MKITQYGKWTALYRNNAIAAWTSGFIKSDEYDGGIYYFNDEEVDHWGSTGHIRGQRVTVPEFAISETPTIRISELKSFTFDVISRYKK